jgi:hypothetical protein
MTDLRMPQDPGELALRIVKGFDGRICTCEQTIEDLEAKISKVIRAEGKRSATRLTVIGAIAVAGIGGLTQWQVTRMNTETQLQTAEMARQKLDDADRNIEKIIEETAKRTSKATLEARDQQVDRLAAKGH